MEAEIISRIELLETGELLLGLEGMGRPDYQYVYREAAGVYWDEKRHGFKSTQLLNWSCAEWYSHIISIVHSGLGIELQLSMNVEWINIPEKDKEIILIAT